MYTALTRKVTILTLQFTLECHHFRGLGENRRGEGSTRRSFWKGDRLDRSVKAISSKNRRSHGKDLMIHGSTKFFKLICSKEISLLQKQISLKISLSVEEIIAISKPILTDIEVPDAYLFGSYVKDNQIEGSDINFAIYVDVPPLNFYDYSKIGQA